jgi:hypothetical protein
MEFPHLPFAHLIDYPRGKIGFQFEVLISIHDKQNQGKDDKRRKERCNSSYFFHYLISCREFENYLLISTRKLGISDGKQVETWRLL